MPPSPGDWVCIEAGMWECSPDQTDSKPRSSSSTARAVGVMEYEVKKREMPNCSMAWPREGLEENRRSRGIGQSVARRRDVGIGECRNGWQGRKRKKFLPQIHTDLHRWFIGFLMAIPEPGQRIDPRQVIQTKICGNLCVSVAKLFLFAELPRPCAVDP